MASPFLAQNKNQRTAQRQSLACSPLIIHLIVPDLSFRNCRYSGTSRLFASATTQAIVSVIFGAKMACCNSTGFAAAALPALPHITIAPSVIVDTPLASRKHDIRIIGLLHPDTLQWDIALMTESIVRRNLVVIVCRNRNRGENDTHHKDCAYQAYQPSNF